MPTLPPNIGFAPPPPGVTPNFEGPRISVLYTVITFLLLALSAVTISLRFFTRKVILRTLGTDDYLLVLAFIFAAISTSTSQVQIKYGLGSHAWNVPLSALPVYQKLYMLAVTTYMTCIMFIKLSLLFLYRRMAVPGYNTFKFAWWTTALVVVGYTMPTLLLTIFQCRPIRAAWDFIPGPRHCINVGNLFVAHGVLNALTDIIFLMLPIPSVWALSITVRQKVIVSLLFALGSFTCVVSIIRLTQITGQPKDPHSDWTMLGLGVSIWSLVELNCGMICASAISLRPFFRKYLGHNNGDIRLERHSLARSSSDAPIYSNAEFARSRTSVGQTMGWFMPRPQAHHSPSKLSDIVESPANDEVGLGNLKTHHKRDSTIIQEITIADLRDLRTQHNPANGESDLGSRSDKPLG